MTRTIFYIAVSVLGFGVDFPMLAQAVDAGFSVGLTVVAFGSRQPIVVELPMPTDSRPLGKRGNTTFNIHDRNLSASTLYFQKALPGDGFTLQIQEQGDVWWHSIWRKGPGACVEILARAVTGAAKTRIQATPIAC